MNKQRAVGPDPSFKSGIRAKTLALFLLGSFLATVVASLLFVKAHHGVLEVTIVSGNGSPSPVFAYFSAKPGNYNPKNTAKSSETIIGADSNTRTVLHSIELHSSKPLYGVRLDPETRVGSVQIKGMKYTTPEGSVVFSPIEIQTMLGAGINIANPEISGEFVTFNSISNDPYFDIAIPKSLATPKIFSRIQGYTKTWLNITLPLFAGLIILLYKNGLPLWSGTQLTAAHWLASIRSRNFFGVIIDAFAIAAIAMASQQLIAMHAGIRIEPLMNIFAADGVGNSVPNEVKAMKAIVMRQGPHRYALAGDLGKDREWSEIYQRATEYLYPAYVDQTSDLAFIRSSLKAAYDARPCKMIDMQHDILLYDCKK